MHLIHDLRLVLVAIAACLDSLHEKAEANPLTREVDDLGRLLQSGLAMIDELLVTSELRPATPHVSVNCLLKHMDTIVSTIVGSDVTVRTMLRASESRVCAERVDIERILFNLVFNAAAAMPSGGTLMIETSAVPNEITADPTASSGDLLLTIRDTGRGMSDGALANAINPLARPRPDGTGLGLASVALLINRLHGTLGIESHEEGGTVVSVTLPLSSGANRIH